MHPSLIDKVNEAQQYAHQPERVRLERLQVTIHGEDDDNQVLYDHGVWTCACPFFANWGTCAHTMAIGQLLGPLVPHMPTLLEEAQEAVIMMGVAIPVD